VVDQRAAELGASRPLFDEPGEFLILQLGGVARLKDRALSPQHDDRGRDEGKCPERTAAHHSTHASHFIQLLDL
jgi:hypothetical protein